MSNLKKKMLLQLFADGGAGGAAAAADAGAGGDDAATGVTGTAASDAKDDVPAFIPEKAKKYYRKAMEKHQQQGSVTAPAASDAKEADDTAAAANNETPPDAQEGQKTHVPFSELIKSPEYKEEHSRYMKAAIDERFKSFNARQSEKDEILSVVGQKYGLDPQSKTFLADLKKATAEDDAYFEAYAAEHDMTTKEARRVLTLEQEVAARRQADAQREEAERGAKAVEALRARALETQKRFPGFDLDQEMKNPAFVRLVAATQGDTTAAYMAMHHGEILPAAVQRATQDAVRATVNNIRGGSARPTENGVSSSAPAATAEPNFRNMKLPELRAYAEALRRRG